MNNDELINQWELQRAVMDVKSIIKTEPSDKEFIQWATWVIALSITRYKELELKQLEKLINFKVESLQRGNR